jgi:hypothetical protein
VKKRLLVMATTVLMTMTVGAGIASAAPGADIRSACGASFGQLVGPARSSGTAAHTNYAGGAAAFADPAVLAAHGCTS